jgi:hypothetical protein
MLTSRRSATGEASVVVVPVACGRRAATTAVPSGVAHWPQNLAVGGLAVPQLGQAAASGVAHSMQNLRPTSFKVPQFEQIKLGGPS